MHRLVRIVHIMIFTLALSLGTIMPVSAHDAPPGSEWVMADWMFLSFIIFAGTAYVAFMLALKSGLLSNNENAKFYLLEIEEEDFYTPDWARGDTGGEQS